ncbi:hypothetical protein [Afifella pfennigii]|uniref:hypothetical protein n=1 Tax=Afifella pfennigii TaxID=209897 RepID=UPI0004788BD2|nr:hypothetical protein [Afifella pfennigii]
MSAALAALEALPLAAALRDSVWAYPLVNAAHILGIALLFGAIAPLDLRLLGAFSRVDVAGLTRILVPVAVFGLVLAAAAGSLLFVTDARDYAGSRFFQAKMLVVLLAVANALALRLAPSWRALRRPGGDLFPVAAPVAEGPGLVVRLAAALSLFLWPTAILLGRLVGYF